MPDKEGQPSTLANIQQRLIEKVFEQEFIKSPQDAIALDQSGASSFWLSLYYNAIAADEARAERDVLGRMKIFESSNYMQAYKALGGEPLILVIDDTDGKRKEPGQPSLQEVAVTLFFAMHDELEQFEPAGLSEDDITALKELYERLCAFVNGSIDTETLGAFLLAEVPQEHHQEVLPHLLAVFPKMHVIPNNKLANIAQNIIDGETYNLIVRKGKKPVETACILTYEGDRVKLSGRRPYTEFDRNVYNAVTSLYVYGDRQHIVTPAMVHRAMMGLADNEKPTQRQLAAVTESLDKMRFIRVRIDCREELKARKITIHAAQVDGEAEEIDTTLLLAEVVKVRTGKNITPAYHILTPPILYTYAAAVRQVLAVPSEILDIKKLNKDGTPSTRSIEYTEQRVRIKGYLLRRIETMKNKKNNLDSRHIRLLDYEKDGRMRECLYSIAGKSNPTKDEARNIRNDAETMLNYWKASKYIKGYTAYKDGKAIAGYTLNV